MNYIHIAIQFVIIVVWNLLHLVIVGDIHIPYLDYITSSSFSVLSYSHSRISNGKRHHKVCSFVC